MNRADFQKIAELRIAEAHALMASVPPQPSGAYYLAGYGVECALKAVICKRYRAHDWPERKFVLDSHTHDLKMLCKLAELDSDRDNRFKVDIIFYDNWKIATDWDESSRYQETDLATAEQMLNAVGEPTYGVLPWLKTHW